MSNETKGGGVGIMTVLTLIFVVLKLTNLISWSWWWVLAPLWGSLALGLVIFVIFMIIMLIVGLFL